MTVNVGGGPDCSLSLAEMFVFLGFLAVGLLYAWRKGVLTWV